MLAEELSFSELVSDLVECLCFMVTTLNRFVKVFRIQADPQVSVLFPRHDQAAYPVSKFIDLGQFFFQFVS